MILKDIQPRVLEELLKDHVQFKIFVAESFLEYIPKTIPNSWSKELAEILVVMESFVYFMISASDILALEINKKLKVVNGKKCDMDNLFESLKKTKNPGQLTTKIHDELGKAFSTPSRSRQNIEYSEYHKITQTNTITGLFGSELDPNEGDYKYYSYKFQRENSWLWELTMLRHEMAHERTLGWQGYVDSDDTRRTTIVLPLKENSNEAHDHYEIDNPYEYCKFMLEKMKGFVVSIRAILNPES